jgi:hypothetical protein
MHFRDLTEVPGGWFSSWPLSWRPAEPSCSSSWPAGAALKALLGQDLEQGGSMSISMNRGPATR